MNAWSLDIIGRVAFGHEFGALAGAKDGHASRYARPPAGLNADILRRFAKGALASPGPRRLRQGHSRHGGLSRDGRRDYPRLCRRRRARAPSVELCRTPWRTGEARAGGLHPGVGLCSSPGTKRRRTPRAGSCIYWRPTPSSRPNARAEADAAPATPSYKDFMAMTTLVGAVYEALGLYTIIIGPAKKTRHGVRPQCSRTKSWAGRASPPVRAMWCPNKWGPRCPHRSSRRPKSLTVRVTAKASTARWGAALPVRRRPRICVGYAARPARARRAPPRGASPLRIVPRGPAILGAEGARPRHTNGPRESGLFLKLVPR